MFSRNLNTFSRKLNNFLRKNSTKILKSVVILISFIKSKKIFEKSKRYLKNTLKTQKICIFFFKSLNLKKKNWKIQNYNCFGPPKRSKVTLLVMLFTEIGLWPELSCPPSFRIQGVGLSVLKEQQQLQDRRKEILVSNIGWVQ